MLAQLLIFEGLSCLLIEDRHCPFEKKITRVSAPCCVARCDSCCVFASCDRVRLAMGLSAADCRCNRVLVEIGESSRCCAGSGISSIIVENLTGIRGDSLPPGFGTLGGDTLGDFQGEGIGKAMLGDRFLRHIPKCSQIFRHIGQFSIAHPWKYGMGYFARLLRSANVVLAAPVA